MRASGTLLPILNDAEWTGRPLTAGRPLFREGDPASSPWVTFAYDDGRRTHTLTIQGLEELGRELDALEAEAVSNLNSRAGRWREAKDAPSVLTLVDEYAAAHLLSTVALDAARGRLGAEKMIAGAPTRGLLALRPEGSLAPEELRAFGEWAKSAYGEALDTRLYPSLISIDGNGALSPLKLAASEPPNGVEPMAAAPEHALSLREYDPEDRRADFDALASPLAPTSRIALRRLMAAKWLEPGKPLEEVRVVFRSRDEAVAHEQELDADGLITAFDDGEGGVREL